MVREKNSTWWAIVYGPTYATGTGVFAQLEATGAEFEEQSGVDKWKVKRGFFSWPNQYTHLSWIKDK